MNSLQKNLVPFVPLVQGTNSTNEHRYSLEKGSKKHLCPDCNKKTFVLYVDTETGNHLPSQFGRCDRENKCSYSCNPYLEGYAKMILEQEQKVTGVTKVTVPKQKYFYTKPKPQAQQENVFFDFDTFLKTLESKRYEKNTFIQNLFYNIRFPFEVNEVTKVIQLYLLGTVANGYRTGANTFPFIDIKGNVRAVQVKQFNKQNNTTGTDFLHSIIEKHHTQNNKPLPYWLQAYTKQEKRITCLFGEHLLSKYHSNPIALVEAPKTAVYGTLYFGLPETPQSPIWLAVYNKSSFTFDKLKVLKGRFVYVFPDLSKEGNTFKEWETKAKEFESNLPNTHFIFSNLLEQLAPQSDKNEGKDLADYLIKQDWRQYRKKDISELPAPTENKKSVVSEASEAPKTKVFSNSSELPQNQLLKFKQTKQVAIQQHQNWNNDIKELETFFSTIVLPDKPLKFDNCSIITDCRKFIHSHIAYIKANNGNSTFLPYLNRLQELKRVLNEQKFN